MFNITKKIFYTSNRSVHYSGAQSIYNGLKNNNVENVFLYSGGAIMSLVDLFKSKDKININYFVNNHEQNCGHAATGYAKSSNKTGVVIVTSGPGVTNMVTPLLDATNETEIYNLGYVATANKVLFNGLSFANGQYVVGDISL